MKVDVQKLTSDTRLLQRLMIAVGVLLVVAVIAFSAYYYYDRFYSSEISAVDLTIQKAQQALAADPENLEKRLDLADANLVNAKYDSAIQNVNQVLLADPENQRAWLILGVGYALKGEPESAIEPLQKYVDANKDSDMPGLNRSLQMAAYHLGESYYKTGQLDKAVETLENTVLWSKTDADAMYKLGLVYSDLERNDDALAMFTYATAFVPNYKEAYEGMAKVFERIKEPDYLNYANGMVAYSSADYTTAIDLLSKSAQAKPDFAPTFAGLGLSYEAAGDLQKSKEAFSAALKLDQYNLTAQQGLQRVEILLKQ